MTSVFGRGVSFPPWVDANGRFAWSEGEHSIRESITVILKTELGERVGVPDFGATLRRFFFEANNAGTHVLPPALQGRMGVSPKGMLDGKGKATLSLIFQWMPFVKICIPFPKKT